MATSTNTSIFLPSSLVSKLANTDQAYLVPNQQQVQKVTAGNQGTTQNQNNALLSLSERQRQARVTKQTTIREARIKLRNKKITPQQFDDIIEAANRTYDGEIASIKANREQIRLSQNSEVKNFRQTIKNEERKIKSDNNKLLVRTTKADAKAKIDLARQVLKNPDTLLLIYPGIGLLITNAFLSFITQRKKLEKQVDAVNLYIDTKVVDEATVIIATNLKNDTIRAINNAIDKLKAIEGIIKTINAALKIATIALKILKLIPVPVPMPILSLFDKLSKIISGLSSILTVCLTILSNEIIKLKELIEKLKQIIIKLNNKTLSILTDSQLLSLIQTILPVGDVSLFQTLVATPVSGSTGFVNIGGRIVPLNSTSAVGNTNNLTDTNIVSGSTGTTTGTGGTGTTAATGTGGTGITTGTGGTGATATTGTGGIGTTGNVVSISPNQVVTSSIGSTNGTGIGLTTTGGTGTGGTNVGPQGTLTPTGLGGGINSLGDGLNLDNGNLTDPTLLGQPLFSTDINQLSLGGIDESGLNQLEQLSLELIQPDNQQLTGLEQIPSLQDQANLYKGFRFQIKEEQDPRFVVRGTIKRRYAVAINKQGVEVLKSEYSFTLDPNDLVDQLKLVIDRQNLQG